MNGVLVGDASLANTKAEIAWKWRSSFRPVELSLTVNVAVPPAGSENGAWPSLTDPPVRGGADGDDLLAVQSLIGGDEDRPGAAQTFGARAAQPSAPTPVEAGLEADVVGQPGDGAGRRSSGPGADRKAPGHELVGAHVDDRREALRAAGVSGEDPRVTEDIPGQACGYERV